MELSQLRTFRVVAETLNFTRAAERLGLTQSAVSHQIKSLETELGEPLFIRAKRGVKLSPAGQAALEHAVRLLDEAEALRERVAGGEHSPAGRVRAAAATQAIVHLFAPLFEAFMRAQPRIDVSFRTTASTDETVADILNGAADVGFASLPVYSPALKIENLFEDELVLVVGHGHRLSAKAEATTEDLRKERLILFERGRLDPPHDRPVLQQGRHPALARPRVERHLVHQAHGRARPSASRSCPRGRCATRWPRAGSPSCGSRATGCAAPWPSSRSPASSPRRRGPSSSSSGSAAGELQQMAEGNPRGDEPKPAPAGSSGPVRKAGSARGLLDRSWAAGRPPRGVS